MFIIGLLLFIGEEKQKLVVNYKKLSHKVDYKALKKEVVKKPWTMEMEQVSKSLTLSTRVNLALIFTPPHERQFQTWITPIQFSIVGGQIAGQRVNQHPPAHHPLDAHYDSDVDEPQLSWYLVSPW